MTTRHHYYGYQHLGHHAALGENPIATKERLLKANEAAGSSMTKGEVERSMVMDGVDGDLPAPSTLILLWGAAVEQAGERVAWMSRSWKVKLLFTPIWHVFHFGMLTVLQLLIGIIANPLVCSVAWLILLLPVPKAVEWARKVLECMKKGQGQLATTSMKGFLANPVDR